eukprot:739293-Pyramimonas_sp.AAC.1
MVADGEHDVRRGDQRVQPEDDKRVGELPGLQVRLRVETQQTASIVWRGQHKGHHAHGDGQRVNYL